MPDVSIIILNYNTFNLTCACINSIYEHTSGITYEIILVDNGSSECSASLFRDRFPRVVVVESSENLGFAKGNNLGIGHSSGKCILLLNSDTEILNNAVALAYYRLLQSDDVGALTGKVLTPDGNAQHVAQRHPSIFLLLLQILRCYRFVSPEKQAEIFIGEYFEYNREIYADWIWATFFLIRRETIACFPEGRLPDNLFMYEEDKLWGHYLRQKSLKLLFTPAPHILHHVSGSSKHRKDVIAQSRIILVNEFQVISITNGGIYARTYFLLKALQYLTYGYEQGRQLAKIDLRIAAGSTNTTPFYIQFIITRT